MTYAIQRDSLIRTRQDLVVVGVRECANWYATLTFQQALTYTEQLDNAIWTKVSIAVVADALAAPDAATTAESVTFDAANDAIYQDSVSPPCASRAFTGSVFMRTPTGTSTVTIRVRNVGSTESKSKQVTLTTAWTRFAVENLFTAAPADAATFEIIRLAGDTAALTYIWGANLTGRTTTQLDQELLFPYTRRVAEGLLTLAVRPSRCSATDQGDGARCFYSRATCQDPDNFNAGNTYEGTAALKGIREFKFCRENAPLALPGEDVLPLLISAPTAPQEIDAERAVTVNERVTFEFEDDAGPGLWNPIQSSLGALVNTATGTGTFWRRWAAIYRNYSNPEGYAIRKVGFVESGVVEADYQTRGRYLIRNWETSDRRIRLVCSDRMKLGKKPGVGRATVQLPAKISTTNLADKISSSGLTVVVTDASQITVPGSGYTVTLELDFAGTPEKVNVTAIDLATNTVTIQRGRWGTTAAAHSNNTAFREVAEFGTEALDTTTTPNGKNPIDIILELLARAGLAAAEIDTATLQTERDTWYPSVTLPAYGTLFRRTMTEATDVEALLTEIRDLIMLFLWTNDSQLVTGKAFAPPLPTDTLTVLTDDANLIAGSIEVDDNDESRVSRALIAYGTLLGTSTDKPEDYSNIRVELDIDAEERAYYGDQRLKTVLTQWLPATGTGVASATYFTGHLIGRFRHGSRQITARIEIKDDAAAMGTPVQFQTKLIQDVYGNNANTTARIMTKRPIDDSQIEIVAIEEPSLTRVGFYTVAGAAVYTSATDDEKRYCYYGDANGLVGTPLVLGYTYW